MQIKFGNEFVYEIPQLTAMVLSLKIHFSRVADLVIPGKIIDSPTVPISGYSDLFGGRKNRVRELLVLIYMRKHE